MTPWELLIRFSLLRRCCGPTIQMESKSEDFFADVHRARGAVEGRWGCWKTCSPRTPRCGTRPKKSRRWNFTSATRSRIRSFSASTPRSSRLSIAGYPRAGDVAGRRHGCDRRVSQGDPPLQDRDGALRRRELAHVVSVSVDQVKLALEALEQKTGVAQRAVEINRLEKCGRSDPRRGRAPAVRRRARPHHDYQVEGRSSISLEVATDRFEDVANLREGVVVKNA